QGRTFASLSGMSVARFSKIIFIDDDIEVSPDLLKVYEKYYREFPDAALIGGPIDIKWHTQTFQRPFVQYLVKYESWVFAALSLGNNVRQLKYLESLMAGNMSINLDQFLVIGDTFRTELGRKIDSRYLYAEDYELCLRLELEGKKVIYVPELCAEN